MYETYEEWFDIFGDECNNLGYCGPIMQDAFFEYYEAGRCPYELAEEFVEELKPPLTSSFR